MSRARASGTVPVPSGGPREPNRSKHQNRWARGSRTETGGRTGVLKETTGLGDSEERQACQPWALKATRVPPGAEPWPRSPGPPGVRATGRGLSHSSGASRGWRPASEIKLPAGVVSAETSGLVSGHRRPVAHEVTTSSRRAGDLVCSSREATGHCGRESMLLPCLFQRPPMSVRPCSEVSGVGGGARTGSAGHRPAGL